MKKRFLDFDATINFIVVASEIGMRRILRVLSAGLISTKSDLYEM